MKKFILLCLGAFTLSFNAKAQSGLEALLLAKEDAEKLTKAYATPAMEGLINAMNGGWYHTAKVHKTLGFDISIGLNASLIPAAKETFDFASLGLTNTKPTKSDGTPLTGNQTGATLGGSGDLKPYVTYTGSVKGTTSSATFQLPGGIKDDVPLNAIPAPAVQLGIGLPFKADVMLRFIPKIGSGNVKGGLFGIGLKKELTSLLGPMDKLPLHISVLGGYTTMNVDYDLQAESSIGGSNQKAEFLLKSYTVQAIASLNFPFINFYGGLGYNGGSADLNMLGKYRLTYNPVGGGAPITETLTDPLKMNFNSSGFRSTLGARLSLGFFKIYGDYTFQEYNTFSAGISFSFR